MADPRPIIKKFLYNGTTRTVTMGFNGECTVHLWGAGGGAGGRDNNSNFGGAGSAGLYNSLKFSFVKGDVIEVAVGEGGLGGSTDGGAPGGLGGKSRINLNGVSSQSFNGANGSKSGPTPYSGSGGGGGGATAVFKNDNVVCVAGGGGGGGGAGNDGNQFTRVTATVLNNASGISGTDYRGETGQTKTGDGGGAGGGGGGYPGGQGGAIFPGDSSGAAGQTGGNFPANDSFYLSGPLYASMDSPRWSRFMRTHSAWPTDKETVATFTAYRTITVPATGNYIFKFCVDNTAQLFVNDVQVSTGTSFSSEPVPFTVNLTKGTHRLKLVGTNFGGPAGWALTVEDSAGQIIWKLRDYLDVDPPGKDNQYYVNGVAKGGQVTGGNGQNGYAVLIFEPKVEFAAASAVKIAGSWRQITEGYVKVSGTWRRIENSYVKKNGVWSPIVSTGDVTNVIFAENSALIGTSSRAYS